MAALARNGFDGFIIDDHVPVMDDDTDWKHRGRAHAIGYMQGLIRMGEYARAFT
jgi:mannonate dehydratase